MRFVAAFPVRDAWLPRAQLLVPVGISGSAFQLVSNGFFPAPTSMCTNDWACHGGQAAVLHVQFKQMWLTFLHVLIVMQKNYTFFH